MTHSQTLPCIHPLLQELGMPLQLQPESSWTYTCITDGQTPISICLKQETEDDLIIEVTKAPEDTTRFVFGATGALVGISHTRQLSGAPYDTLRQSVLTLLRTYLASH